MTATAQVAPAAPTTPFNYEQLVLFTWTNVERRTIDGVLHRLMNVIEPEGADTDERTAALELLQEARKQRMINGGAWNRFKRIHSVMRAEETLSTTDWQGIDDPVRCINGALFALLDIVWDDQAQEALRTRAANSLMRAYDANLFVRSPRARQAFEEHFVSELEEREKELQRMLEERQTALARRKAKQERNKLNRKERAETDRARAQSKGSGKKG